MEEVENMTQDDVLEVINDFPLTPMRNKVIITVNVKEPDGNLVLAENSFDEVQYVVATGSHSNNIQAGQKVLLNLEKMMVFEQAQTDAYERVGHIKITPLDVGDRVYGMITDNMIDALDNRK